MKVEKERFDALLGKLLKTAPIKGEDIIGRRKRKAKAKQPKPSQR